ncbi:MAG: TetR family transcriptional regulator [Elusimicrobia bacterium]|nr:TetR family transcriptional regulator [Elusimicrobiota bacterium]
MAPLLKDRRDARRKELLDAAYERFMQYGYSKTTFDDIAQKAGVSRTLLYAYFEDKKELFRSVARDVLDGQRLKTEAVLESKETDEEKLVAILELWSVELYARIADKPHGGELLEEGYRAWEKIGVHYMSTLVRALAPLAGGPEVAELLILSLGGLQQDHPTVAALRKRVSVLARLARGGKKA